MKLTPFQKKVYRVVSRIPLGEVRSYQWVAEKAGYPRAGRAVGQAMARNPWPLVIPCHRVVASSGRIGGYAWGVEAKKTLLELERQIRQSML